jgi:breakpoint cluster region protein
MDLSTLTVIWDQDFEIETVGTCFLKAFIFYKYLLKEEVCATGKLKLPVKNLKASKRCKLDITLHPQGCLTIVVEYFPNIASMGKRPALLSSGVFGFSMDIVAKRENHSIPLIVQTCVDEVERRGLAEVGIYRVAGVLRDVQELRAAFDTDYIIAQQLAYDTDIHAVAGLLKRYFRELPDPLFTDELYMSFVQALGNQGPSPRCRGYFSLQLWPTLKQENKVW